MIKQLNSTMLSDLFHFFFGGGGGLPSSHAALLIVLKACLNVERPYSRLTDS